MSAKGHSRQRLNWGKIVFKLLWFVGKMHSVANEELMAGGFFNVNWTISYLREGPGL